MAGPQAGPRFWRFAAKTVGRPGVDDLCAACGDDLADPLERCHGVGVLMRSESVRRPGDRAGFERPALGLPFRQPALENEHVLGAEQAEREPHPRRSEHAVAVIGNDGVVVADAELACGRGERRRRRQHMRQVARVVGDLVDIETQRTRDVSGKIFSRSVALHRRQVIRAIEDNEAGGVEIGGEPVGGHQPFAAWMWRWLYHMRLSQGARLAEDSGGGTIHHTFSNGTVTAARRSIHVGTGNPLERRNSGLNSLVW